MAAASELFDVLDELGSPTGVTKERACVHADGDWHRALHLWVLGPGAAGGYSMLFQRRSEHKDTNPGLLDVSVGGHFRAGEDFGAVLRETDEELGFTVSPVELEHLHDRQVERTYPGITDREFQHVYMTVRDVPLKSYTPGCAEVTVVYEVPLLAALELYEHGTPVAAAGWDCQGRNNNALLYDADVIPATRPEIIADLKAIAERVGVAR